MRLACTIPAIALDVELLSCRGGGRPTGHAQTVAC
jgi:hypothetical protein